MNLDEHVGKKLIALNINITSSPTIEAIMPFYTQEHEIAKILQEHLRDAVDDLLGPNFAWTVSPLTVEVHPRTGVIKTLEERKAALKELCKMTQEDEKAQKETERKFQYDLDNHPQNGKLSWWYVGGVRHEAHVRASSAREAYNKVIKSEIVGEWEATMPDYIGAELPDVF